MLRPFAALFRRFAGACLAAAVVFAPAAVRADDFAAYSDRALIDGFRKTVFGLEFSNGRFARMVKKYPGAVRVRIVNTAAVDRTADVAAFIRSLPRAIPGLDIALAGKGAANYTVYVVDRPSYASVVRSGVLGTHSGPPPGQCVVRIVPTEAGIRQSQAVIVSDEGDSLFHRCMVEEILQGLGPINDNASLSDSVFNDRSEHDRFMPFDRAIVSMLYDRRIRPGMSESEATAVLPGILADLRRRQG